MPTDVVKVLAAIGGLQTPRVILCTGGAMKVSVSSLLEGTLANSIMYRETKMKHWIPSVVVCDV